MSAYKHILVGLDLSEDSEEVLSKAQEIANAFSANLSVAHVLEPLAFAYGGDVPIDLSEAQNIMITQAQERLAKISDKHNISTNNQIVNLGHTPSALHELAESRESDLIIVGSHGRHGLALLFGSTAKGVLKGAQCDVLAIKV